MTQTVRAHAPIYIKWPIHPSAPQSYGLKCSFAGLHTHTAPFTAAFEMLDRLDRSSFPHFYSPTVTRNLFAGLRLSAHSFQSPPLLAFAPVSAPAFRTFIKARKRRATRIRQSSGTRTGRRRCTGRRRKTIATWCRGWCSRAGTRRWTIFCRSTNLDGTVSIGPFSATLWTSSSGCSATCPNHRQHCR